MVEAIRTECPTMDWFKLIVGVTAAIGLLYVGRTFLVPLAIAVLISSLLGALIDQIARLRLGGHTLPRWIATLLSICIVLGAVVVVGNVIASQIGGIREIWPQYAARLETIVANFVSAVGEETSAEVVSALREIDIVKRVPRMLGSLGSSLTSLGLIILYVTFMLLERRHFPNKIAAMFSDAAELETFNRISSLVADGVRQYIGLKTLMSMLTGGSSYVIFRLVGLDFAETWAILIFLLNYIPTIGSIIGVVFPTLLALLQFETITPFLIIATSCTGLQVLIGNIVEPSFMGRTLNLSSLVIVLSLIFWGTLWGFAGAFLSVPIAVIAMIVCTHVPQWRPVAILLSKDGRVLAAKSLEKEQNT